MSHIGANIKTLREANGWSQSDLARTIGKTRQSVSQWESGQSEPSMGTLITISRALRVSPSEIMDRVVQDPKAKADTREATMASLFSQLSDAGKDAAIAIIRDVGRYFKDNDGVSGGESASSFSDTVSGLMKSQGITAKELAELSGVNSLYISRLLSGKIKEPTWEKACAIIGAFGLIMNQFRRMQEGEGDEG